MVENDALKVLVADAIFKALDEKKREELIKSALEGLLEKRGESYYGGLKRSNLEQAFDTSVYEVAREIVRDHVKNNAKWREMIQDVVVKALERVIGRDESREELIGNIASAISSAFKVQDR